MRDQQSQPDTSIPPAERKAELEAAYEQQKDTDAPYKNIVILSLSELQWIMQQRQWSNDYDLPNGMQRANLSGANLSEANLSGAFLVEANLSGASLPKVNLNGANLDGANLSGASLYEANLNGANLTLTDLNGATLIRANLNGTDLSGANLSGASLISVKFDSNTTLADITLATTTMLRNVRWNSVDLTGVAWEQVSRLGDDTERSTRNVDKARANRQLATQLREQSINGPADRFAYRARIWERRATREQGIRGFFPYLGSLFLDFMAGYGYRPVRTILVYLLVILSFLLIYMHFGVLNASCTISGQTATGTLITACSPAHTLSPQEAFVFSLTSFHGRGFFPGGLGLDSPITLIAAFEAVLGLIIEVSFIATFTQRFFAR